LAERIGSAIPSSTTMPNLRSQLNALAANFAQQILAAIQGSSLEELVGSGRSSVESGPSARIVTAAEGSPSIRKAGRKPGRLPRRSADEIAALLNKIILLVKTHKDGMRAEEIRSALGMEAKEMPRILKEGILKKKLTTKGQKRATTYFAK
jgi:hypothetical protein